MGVEGIPDLEKKINQSLDLQKNYSWFQDSILQRNKNLQNGMKDFNCFLKQILK